MNHDPLERTPSHNTHRQVCLTQTDPLDPAPASLARCQPCAPSRRSDPANNHEPMRAWDARCIEASSCFKARS